MARQETVDFMIAFAIGTMLGVGATLLLRSESESETERVLRSLGPLRKRIRAPVRRALRRPRDGSDAATAVRSALLDTGRSVLADLREEILDLVSDAREEIVEVARDTMMRARENFRTDADD